MEGHLKALTILTEKTEKELQDQREMNKNKDAVKEVAKSAAPRNIKNAVLDKMKAVMGISKDRLPYEVVGTFLQNYSTSTPLEYLSGKLKQGMSAGLGTP